MVHLVPYVTAKTFIDLVFNIQDRTRLVDALSSPAPFFLIDADGKRSLLGQEGMFELSMTIDNFLMKINTKHLNDNDRGAILSFFSKIEFIIDVLVLSSDGVYENKGKYESARKFWIEDELMTTSRRIKYLKYKKVISGTTKDKLHRAKEVRDVLAHRYKFELGLYQALVSKLGEQLSKSKKINLSEAISGTMNQAWTSLMEDFVKHQDKIAQHLYDSLPKDMR